jgi:hypothetical protein
VTASSLFGRPVATSLFRYAHLLFGHGFHLLPLECTCQNLRLHFICTATAQVSIGINNVSGVSKVNGSIRKGRRGFADAAEQFREYTAVAGSSAKRR